MEGLEYLSRFPFPGEVPGDRQAAGCPAACRHFLNDGAAFRLYNGEAPAFLAYPPVEYKWMRNNMLVLWVAVVLAVVTGNPVFAQAGYTDAAVGTVQTVTTAAGFKLASAFGPADQFYAVFRIFPLVPGKRYEAILTYDAGTDMGFAHSWVDGDPAAKDWASFVGIGSGTGSREMKGKEDRFLFTVDAGSTSNVLYVLVRSARPWPIRFAVTDKLSGVNRDSQNRWGYYYVTDFDLDRTAPFLLKRGGTVAATGPSGDSVPAARIIGPLSFSAGKMAGSLRLARISDREGVAWLRVERTGVEEILNAVFKGSEVKFARTVDCRLGASRSSSA